MAERLTARAMPLEDFMARSRATPPIARAGHRGLHDRAAARHAAGARAQPPLQQGAARARRRPDRDAPRRCRTSRARTRSRVEPLGHGVYNVRVQYGFMQDPNVPEALALAARARASSWTPRTSTYFLGRETIIVTHAAGHGDLAREAVRADGAQRRPRHRLLPAAARARRRAGRPGGDVVRARVQRSTPPASELRRAVAGSASP